jgi:multiple sugar transport system permease protein
MKRRGQVIARKGVLSVAIWILVLVVSFPLFWMVSTALKPAAELMQIPPTVFPRSPTLSHFADLLFKTPFPTYFLNSTIVACGTTLIVLVVGTLGAHSLVRFQYPGREWMARIVLFTYLLPHVVIVIPLYLLVAELGIINTPLSLVFTYSAFALPFGLWLLRSFMSSIPPDLESAALVDGASRMAAFFDIILPLARPGILTTALFTFILAWNEYLYALVMVSKDVNKTLPVGVITLLTTGFDVDWSLLMAASVLMSAPLVILFAVMQKYLTRGFGTGGVKG